MIRSIARIVATVLSLLTGPVYLGWQPALAQAIAQPAPRAPTAFDLPLAASVFSAALAFIAPRALDPVSVQQLALWGLNAPASLDGALSTEVRGNTVVLLQEGNVVYSRPVPAEAGPDAPGAWGAVAAEVLDAAAKVSPTVAAAGSQGAITGFFDSLFDHLDPYSRYIAAAAADTDRARRDGEAGIGITIGRLGRTLVVADVNADGPAAEAGIKAGDRILDIDGQSTVGADLETVQDWISGLEGTDLSITVRTRNAAPRTLDVERAVIPPETVFASVQDDLLVLRISRFSADTDRRMQRELTQGLVGRAPTGRRPIRGVVLDLRGNRGGLLAKAVAVADMVLERGTIATTAGRNPLADHVWNATPGDLAEGRPIVILVDGGSASASEVLAAALADQGRATVVGSATLGKGLVQAIKKDLPDDGELFVSWSRLVAPHGWPLQGLGVLPQVCTSLGQDVLGQQLQALDHGEQPMAAALARHNSARAPLPAAQALAIRNACPASEARDADMAAARFLVAHPAAYTAALIAPPVP